MQNSKRLLQNAMVAITCTLLLLLGPFAGQIGTFVPHAYGNDYQPSSRQVLEQMLFAKRITLLVDGQEQRLWTGARTVEEAIRSSGVALGPWDRAEPSLGSPVVDNMQVKVIRVEQTVIEEEVSVPYRTLRVSSVNLDRGVVREVRSGQNGKLMNTYQVLMENGRVKERKLLNSVTLVEKRDRVIEEGVVSTLSRGGQTLRFTKVIEVEATAYTSDYNPVKGRPDDPWKGLTASGQKAVVGLTIATDPKVIPMHSRVYIEGLDSVGKQYNGTYVAMDTGGAIKGNKIDVYVATYEEAVRFGRRKLKVYILER